MSFDLSDVRPPMDVFTRDNVYLGTVLRVVEGPAAPPEEQVPSLAQQASVVNGEMLGPAPTQTIGNPGPAIQSARARYATAPDAARPIGKGTITVGKWWGLGGRRTIPLDAVQNVSLERVIVSLE